MYLQVFSITGGSANIFKKLFHFLHKCGKILYIRGDFTKYEVKILFKKDMQSLPDVEKLNTLIGENAVIEGNIKVIGNIKVDGSILGSIGADGDVFIGENARVHGNISGNDVVVAGIVEGNIDASARVTMRYTSKVKGNIRTCGFVVEVGSVFNGKCSIENKSSGEVLDSLEEATLEKTLKLVE